METISLCFCSGVKGAQVVLIAAFRLSSLLVSLIFPWRIFHRFSLRFQSGQSSDRMKIFKPDTCTLAVGESAKN